MPRCLSLEQIDRYERDGFVFPIDAPGLADAEKARARFEDVRPRLGDHPRASRFGQWHLFFRWAYDLVTHPAVLDAVEDLLGPDLIVHSSTIFAKPSRSARFISWHQDGYYLGLDPPLWTSAWIALTESHAGNGAMRAVRGSHRHAALPHVERPEPDNILRKGLSVEIAVDESAAVDIELRPGQMSLHHFYLIHGSKANGSATPRIGMAIRYIAPGARQRRPHHAVVLARGQDRFAHFTPMQRPPDGSIDDGLAAQLELARWLDPH